MVSLNKVILAGNLTRDPETHYRSNDQPYVRCSLAVNRTRKNEAGETREEVTFVDLEAWAHQAELICHYLRKGSPLLVEGRLRYDTWQDKQTGQKRSKLLVVVESVQFVNSTRADTGGAAPRPATAQDAVVPAPTAAPASAAPAEPEASVSEPRDVPF